MYDFKFHLVIFLHFFNSSGHHKYVPIHDFILLSASARSICAQSIHTNTPSF